MLLAVRGSEITQSFLLSDLPRVGEMSSDANAEARLRVQFRNIDGQVSIDGEVTGTLQMRCQRCLQSVNVAVEDAFSLVLVNAESELDKLAPEQDAIVTEASRLDLSWLAEEQLLLAAPLVPLHTDGECGKAAISPAKGASDAVKPAETQRPFADLRELLKNR
jgi:uncharacterized protein